MKKTVRHLYFEGTAGLNPLLNMSVSIHDTEQITSEYATGFRYFEDVISPKQENHLLEWIRTLNLKPYVMRGQPSRRKIVRFGFDYGPVGGSHHVVEPLPSQLIRLRDICAARAGWNGKEFIASVVSEYAPGATIGWHSDMTMFGPVVFGVSFHGYCLLKLRPKAQPRKVFNITLNPRSLYVMEGQIRSGWEHSIPPVKMLRYSITFRTVCGTGDPPAGRA